MPKRNVGIVRETSTKDQGKPKHKGLKCCEFKIHGKGTGNRTYPTKVIPYVAEADHKKRGKLIAIRAHRVDGSRERG